MKKLSLLFVLLTACGLPEQFREPCADTPDLEPTCADDDGFTACVDDSAFGVALPAATYARLVRLTSEAWEAEGYDVADCLRDITFQIGLYTEDGLIEWCGILVKGGRDLWGCSYSDGSLGFVDYTITYTPVLVHEISHVAAWCATGDPDSAHQMPVWWHDGASSPAYHAYEAEALSCGQSAAPWAPIKRSDT